MNTIILNFLLVLSIKVPSERSLESVSDLGFNVRPKYRGHTETGPRFEVSSERPEERRIEPRSLN